MNEVKAILLGMATTQQTLYVAIDSMMSEIVALRETVRGLDPTFSDVMEQRRTLAVADGIEAREAMHASLDMCIQLISRLPD
jgi:hypothetical protein